MTSTTNPAAAILELCDRAEDRHYPWIPQTDDTVTECYLCAQPWPCDAHQAAAALRETVKALEWYADRDNIRVAIGTNALNPHIRAVNALTAAVRHIEGGGE